MSLAKNLVRARQAAGLTQAEVAKKLKKSRSSVNEYETGEHVPRMPVLTQLAKVLGTTVAELMA